MASAALEAVSGERIAAPRSIGTGERLDGAGMRSVQLRSMPRPERLDLPLTVLRGAGKRLSATAASIGIHNVGQLLAHVPHGYRDHSAMRKLGELRLGEEATVIAEVRSARVRPTRRRNLRIVEATVADETGPLKAVWFNQAYLVEKLRPGVHVLLHGKLDRQGLRVSSHEIVDPRAGATGIHTLGIVPVHSATEGLSANKLRDWAWQAMPLVFDEVEPLPAELRARRSLPLARDAVRAAHFPQTNQDARTARVRLAFEELFLHQVALAARRRAERDGRPGITLKQPSSLVGGWLDSLPFDPTADQLAALDEIDRDLSSGRPMQRLLMGEVGSGKTLIALYAMLRAVEGGYQAALMAPTETLAEQHAITLDRLLGAAGPPFTLLTGATSAARRRETLGRLDTGELAVIVGTHALLEPDVRFARLAVAVVDEQHRFGVRQRALLAAKGPELDGRSRAPHVLHMTATPIPRTLSLTAYGDLDTTTLRELPAGRQAVKTWAVGEEKRPGAYEFIRERLREGRQAFVVCPLVEGSEKLEAKAASEEAERLRHGELRGFSVGLLHGQLSSREKAEAMAAFAAGDTDVLVATTVIEVGIDVPNATVMLIEGAERFGLSQLHQLRGRIGRGAHESQCILFAEAESELARRRIAAIAGERDGFKLAEVDLALRGEGEILGTLQSGLPRFRVAVLPDDLELLLDARREVGDLIERHGSLDAPELGPLLSVARRRFGDERDERLAA